MIPYGRQEITQADIDAVVEVLRSDLSASTAAARGAVQTRSLLRLDFWAEFFFPAR